MPTPKHPRRYEYHIGAPTPVDGCDCHACGTYRELDALRAFAQTVMDLNTFHDGQDALLSDLARRAQEALDARAAIGK